MNPGILNILDQKIVQILTQKPLRTQELKNLTLLKVQEDGLEIPPVEVVSAIHRLLSLREIVYDEQWRCIPGQPYKPIGIQDKKQALKDLGFIGTDNDFLFSKIEHCTEVYAYEPFNLLKKGRFEQRVHYAQAVSALEALQVALQNLNQRISNTRS